MECNSTFQSGCLELESWCPLYRTTKISQKYYRIGETHTCTANKYKASQIERFSSSSTYTCMYTRSHYAWGSVLTMQGGTQRTWCLSPSVIEWRCLDNMGQNSPTACCKGEAKAASTIAIYSYTYTHLKQYIDAAEICRYSRSIS